MDRKTLLGVSVAAGVATVAALGAAAAMYYVIRDDDEGDEEGKWHVTSRPTTLEIRIRPTDAGVVIGRRGENIRSMETKTNTMIHFRDEMATDTERVLVIRGASEDVQLAEILVQQTLANQPRLETLELKVPPHCGGWIIGRDGENIRSMQEKSRCKINVERDTGSDGLRSVRLRGTSDQIRIARKLIEAVVTDYTRKNSSSTRAPRRTNSMRKYRPHLFLTCDDDQPQRQQQEQETPVPQERLALSTGEKSIGVYVSSIENPYHFHVQKVGPHSIQLDRLVEDMTSFYENADNFESDVDLFVGEVVAAKWDVDGKWYRARIVAKARQEDDDYLDSEETAEEAMFDVDYVDFGDRDRRSRSQLATLKSDFFALGFQAIPCCLDGVMPSSDSWSPAAEDTFEVLSKCAQWKELQAEVKGYDAQSGRAIVVLIDSSGPEDVDVGLELVNLGYAKPKKSAITEDTEGRAMTETEAVRLS